MMNYMKYCGRGKLMAIVRWRNRSQQAPIGISEVQVARAYNSSLQITEMTQKQNLKSSRFPWAVKHQNATCAILGEPHARSKALLFQFYNKEDSSVDWEVKRSETQTSV